MIGLERLPSRTRADATARGVLLGLDLGAYSLKAVRVSRTRDGLRLEHARNVPYARPLLVSDPEGALDSIAEALTQGRIHGARFRPLPVALTLPLCMTQVRLLDAPADEEFEIEEAILSELAAEENTREEDWLGDCWRVQLPADDENASVGVVGARRQWVEALISLLEELRLEPRVIDGAPFVLARALTLSNSHADMRREETLALLDLGYESAFFVILRRGMPVYFRTLRGCGVRNLSDAIQQGLQLDEREAHLFLKTCSQAALRPSAASQTMLKTLREIASLPLRRLQNELARTLDFARRQNDALDLRQITLVGGGALLPSMTELFESWTELNVRLWNARLDPLSEVQSDALPPYAQAIALADLGRSV